MNSNKIKLEENHEPMEINWPIPEKELRQMPSSEIFPSLRQALSDQQKTYSDSVAVVRKVCGPHAGEICGDFLRLLQMNSWFTIISVAYAVAKEREKASERQSND